MRIKRQLTVRDIERLENTSFATPLMAGPILGGVEVGYDDSLHGHVGTPPAEGPSPPALADSEDCVTVQSTDCPVVVESWACPASEACSRGCASLAGGCVSDEGVCTSQGGVCPSRDGYCLSFDGECVSTGGWCLSTGGTCTSEGGHCPSIAADTCDSVDGHCESVAGTCHSGRGNCLSVAGDCPSTRQQCESVDDSCPSMWNCPSTEPGTCPSTSPETCPSADPATCHSETDSACCTPSQEVNCVNGADGFVDGLAADASGQVAQGAPGDGPAIVARDSFGPPLRDTAWLGGKSPWSPPDPTT